MEIGPGLRWLRAVAFAAACAGLAAAGHLLGGGSIDHRELAAGFLVMLLPAASLAGRERSLNTILPAVAGSQAVLHLLLSMAGHGHAAVHPVAGRAASMPGMNMSGSPGMAMLLMHAVAVLLTSAWLAKGEAAVCALARRLATWVLRPLTRLTPRPVRALQLIRPILPACPHTGSGTVLRHVLIRRGPPFVALAPG